MALPLAPFAIAALGYGSVALAAFTVARNLPRGRRDQRAEDALDSLDDGVFAQHDQEAGRVSGRYRRVIRLGASGPTLEVDLAALARLKIRRITEK